nr:immunoglobulin heavy chain junction region [Mus musculus]
CARGPYYGNTHYFDYW